MYHLLRGDIMNKNIETTCCNCGKKYIVSKKIFLNAEKFGRNHFCSPDCQFKFRKSGKYEKCFNCGKEIYVTKSEMKKSKRHFCSVKCAHKCIQHGHKLNDETKEKIRQGLIKYNFENESKRNDGKIKKTCPVCEKHFFVPVSLGKRIYCSKKCYLIDKKCLFRKNGNGGKRHGSGRGKKGWYKGYYCDSSWELAYVIYNLEHEIEFKRNKQGFEYWYLGKKHKFYPDFILKDGTYVEIKGAMTEQNKVKISSFCGSLTVLDNHGIKAYLDYVESKYGKDFINFYENNPYNEKTNQCVICGEPCKNIYCSRRCSAIGAKSKKPPSSKG